MPGPDGSDLSQGGWGAVFGSETGIKYALKFCESADLRSLDAFCGLLASPRKPFPRGATKLGLSRGSE